MTESVPNDRAARRVAMTHDDAVRAPRGVTGTLFGDGLLNFTRCK